MRWIRVDVWVFFLAVPSCARVLRQHIDPCRASFLLAFIFIMCGHLGGQAALAVPMAKWGDRWEVNFDRRTGFGDVDQDRAFGQSATRNAQTVEEARGRPFEPLPGVSAWAKSRTEAHARVIAPPPNPGSNGFTGVSFERTFLLQSSPAGWNVVLAADVRGVLFPNVPAKVQATVDAFAVIAHPTPPLVPTIPVHPDLLLTFSHGQELETQTILRPIFDAKTVKFCCLEDGIYSARGHLGTAARTGFFFGGSAIADFFDFTTRNKEGRVLRSGQNDGFRMALSATPVTELSAAAPEPSTMLLVGTGAAALGWAAAWRRRERMQRLNRPVVMPHKWSFSCHPAVIGNLLNLRQVDC